MDMFLKMLSLLVFILIGYLAKRLGIVREQAISTLSIIILDFTLPCTIIRNFNGVFPDPHVFTLLLLGFLLNFLCLGIGWLTGGRDRDSRGFSMINISGYNIGMFAMAFIQSFFPPSIFILVFLIIKSASARAFDCHYVFKFKILFKHVLDFIGVCLAVVFNYTGCIDDGYNFAVDFFLVAQARVFFRASIRGSSFNITFFC